MCVGGTGVRACSLRAYDTDSQRVAAKCGSACRYPGRNRAGPRERRGGRGKSPQLRMQCGEVEKGLEKQGLHAVMGVTGGCCARGDTFPQSHAPENAIPRQYTARTSLRMILPKMVSPPGFAACAAATSDDMSRCPGGRNAGRSEKGGVNASRAMTGRSEAGRARIERCLSACGKLAEPSHSLEATSSLVAKYTALSPNLAAARSRAAPPPYAAKADAARWAARRLPGLGGHIMHTFCRGCPTFKYSI
eukprot:2352309-Pleurochrysis_carterae.AAC.3